MNENRIVANLIYRFGEEERRVVLREGDSLRIGRFEGNDLVLPLSNISRFHSVLNAGEGAVFLTDLNSMNGTYVNRKRIVTPVALSHGDVISVADIDMRIELESVTLSMKALREVQETGATQSLEMQIVNVTVLVADVSNYTKMSEVLPADDVAKMLRRWLDTVAGVVTKHGGEVSKTLGDAIMATWSGNPRGTTAVPPTTLAAQALQAAVAMKREVSDLIATGVWPHQATMPWRFKTSLNSGEALEGMLSAGEKREFTVLGDTINVTFRLNDLASAFGQSIVLSKATSSLVEGLTPLKSLGDVALEGREERIEVFAVE